MNVVDDFRPNLTETLNRHVVVDRSTSRRASLFQIDHGVSPRSTPKKPNEEWMTPAPNVPMPDR
ncbi:MAG: hypothetical protein ROR55_09835 [Devosia sp.]